MRYSLNDPVYWHKRADETRAMADNLKNPEARDAMLTIAESYERLARDAVKQALPGEETGPTPNPRQRGG
jgi:hypothetical protein